MASDRSESDFQPRRAASVPPGKGRGTTPAPPPPAAGSPRRAAAQGCSHKRRRAQSFTPAVSRTLAKLQRQPHPA